MLKLDMFLNLFQLYMLILACGRKIMLSSKFKQFRYFSLLNCSTIGLNLKNENFPRYGVLTQKVSQP